MEYTFPNQGLNPKDEEIPAYVIVSSETLNDIAAGWKDVPAQHMILIDEKKTIHLRSL